MRLSSSRLRNVAWFKLADIVARGEKERALSVYKLLMHSVADQAFMLQLEGDILSAFNDQTALERYHVSALLYQQQQAYQKAIAVYEHACLFRLDVKILQSLLDLYVMVHDYENVIKTFSRFATAALTIGSIDEVMQALRRYGSNQTIGVQAELYGTTFLALLWHQEEYPEIEFYLMHALKLYVQCHKAMQYLPKFLSKLQACNTHFYQLAQRALLTLKV